MRSVLTENSQRLCAYCDLIDARCSGRLSDCPRWDCLAWSRLTVEPQAHHDQAVDVHSAQQRDMAHVPMSDPRLERFATRFADKPATDRAATEPAAFCLHCSGVPKNLKRRMDCGCRSAAS